MSRMHDEVCARRPDWTQYPEGLERAWSWMEDQGFGFDAPAGYVLSPYPADSGPVPYFMATTSLEGYFDPDTPAYARLLPIGEAAGDGSILALWRDDSEVLRVVVLDSEGSGFLIADDVRALLTLLAVGYDEFSSFTFGDEPDDPIPAEALAPLRGWLATEFDITAPGSWPETDEDAFSAWLDEQLG